MMRTEIVPWELGEGGDVGLGRYVEGVVSRGCSARG